MPYCGSSIDDRRVLMRFTRAINIEHVNESMWIPRRNRIDAIGASLLRLCRRVFVGMFPLLFRWKLGCEGKHSRTSGRNNHMSSRIHGECRAHPVLITCGLFNLWYTKILQLYLCEPNVQSYTVGIRAILMINFSTAA